MDLEFALQCVVLSTCKIYEIKTELNEIEITTLVRSTFKDGIRITLIMDGPELISIQTLSNNELITFHKFQAQVTAADNQERENKENQILPLDPSGRFKGKSACQLINNRRALFFRSWLTTAIQPLISQRLTNKQLISYTRVPDELKVKLEWVYGIRSSDARKALQYTVGSLAADSVGAVDAFEKQQDSNNEELVYFVASVVILLNPNVKKQRFYLCHDQEVISVAVSPLDGQLIASGELAYTPAIHIWSRQTLETLGVIKGLHCFGVHLLQFTNENKFLVTCGLNNPSAIIIYDWLKSEVIISTSINAPTQEIFSLYELFDTEDYPQVETENQNQDQEIRKKPQSGVVVISLREILIFTVTNGEFSQIQLPFEAAQDIQISQPICGMSLIANYKNAFREGLELEAEQHRHIFLTGHKDGKIHLWKHDGYIGTLTDYKDEITCMSKCFEAVAICTWRGMIHLWDLNLSQCIKTIELSNLPFKLLSLNITSVDYNQKRLLLLTRAGDIIQIKLTENGSAKSNKVEAKRINQVVKIQGQQKAMSVLNQDQSFVVIGGDDGLVTCYDIATHELIDVWALGANVTALATLSLQEGGCLIAAGTSVGNLILRQDWEEIMPRYHSCGSKTVNDLQFSKNGQLLAAASSDKNIYLFQYQDSDYIKLTAIKLENGFPISVNFSYDSKKIVICTNQRKLVLLDSTTFTLMFKPEDLSAQFWSEWIGRYPLVTKSTSSSGLIPICLGNKSNIVAAGDENGNLYLWRDSEAIKDHIGINLTGHSSSLQRISITEDDKRVISLGQNDQSIFQWKVSFVEQKPQEGKAQVQPKYKQLENKIILQDVSLINELNFCFVKQEEVIEMQQVDKSEIVDNGLLIRGCNNQTINRIMAKLNFEFEEATWKRQPAVALVLDHIYGVQTSDRRSTVIYMHIHEDKNTQDVSNTDDNLIRSVGGKQHKPKSITYDQIHSQCHKHLVYFTSRFGILYSTVKNSQKFYQGHSLKISCTQKHPFRRLIATGEVSLKPNIHIWDTETLESVIVLETAHQGGVLQIEFSPDGKKLVSIGMDRVYSIQVFLWEQNRTLAFRNLGYYPVFSLKFFPFENSKFITCGYEHMAIWALNGNHLTCQTFQKYECQKIKQDGERLRSCLMSIDFLNYRLGHSISSDVLFGTSQGEVLTYCSGKIFMLNDNAHKGSVNCLRVSDQLQENVCVITGGEDGFIKIWDTSLTLLQQIDMRSSAKVLKDLKNQRCYGVQSLEMYCCDRNDKRRLLVGLRCGEILEAVITDSDDKIAQQTIAKKAGQAIGKPAQQSAMLNLEFYNYVSAHSSLNISQNQKKILCVVMPGSSVLASVGDDETLRFWDLTKKQIIINKYLGAQATAITFSPDGAYLIVGLLNGVMLVLEARLGRLNFGSYIEEFTMPSLDVKMSPKEAKAAIIQVKFSYRGDYMAVSFNNETKGDAKAVELGAVEPSFVLIYVNKISLKNPDIKSGTGGDPYVKLMKIVLPLADFQSSKVVRSQLAVTHFDFSEDDNYLQMCIQKINREAVIEPESYNQEENIFFIWDIKNNTMVINPEQLKAQKWPDWSMAPAINTRFHGSEINLEDPIAERQLLFKELCYMSKVQRFTQLNNAICGSHLGGLYLFRFPALTIEKLKVADFRFDLVKKKEMAATRCFSGHTSMIQSIEILQDKQVMTTSITDQCIVQWRVEYEDQHWELDFNQFLTNIDDPFSEFLNRISFDKMMQEKWNVRVLVSDINQGVSKKEFEDPACELEIENIIGRRAIDRRGNIKLDCMDRISYQASSFQVYLTENDDVSKNAKTGQSLIKQVFLRPDGDSFRTLSPELSCFCFSTDLRILYCATAQLQANIYIWEVTTKMKLAEFCVPNVPIITNIKVAHDNKLILLLGITKEYYQMITMIDWTKGPKVIFTRQFLHSLTYRIRDIEFMPDSTRYFVTSGIQHMCFWRVSGQNLEYKVGELTIPKAFATIGTVATSHIISNQGKFGLTLVTDEFQQQILTKQSNKQDDDLENLFVTFLNILFVGPTLITGGDDGYLYLWEGERIVRRIFAHEGAIFALHGKAKLGLVVSGGMEGIVTLWRLLIEQKSNTKSLERLRIINLRKNMDPFQAVMTPECNVQSVCLGYNKVIVGVRSGSIFEVAIKNDKKSDKADTNDVKRWIKCADNDSPQSVGIDLNSQRIFVITQNGQFSVWDLKTFDVIYQKHYQRKTRSLQVWKLSHKVMLIFQNEIMVLATEPKLNKFEEKADYSLILNQITYATLNQNEQILGVATTSATAPEVTLYSTDNGGFMKLKQIFGFKQQINYLDFSTDNGYMQVEDKSGEVTLYEIETDRPIKTEAIEFDLEWLGDGLRTYSRMKGVRHQYNNQNKIVKINKLLGKPIVLIADQMGTIRLFNYPNVKGEPYYKCYSDHQFTVSDLMFSADQQYLLTSCKYDKCIFKWRVKLNDEKIQKMIEEDRIKINQLTLSSNTKK